MMQSARDLGKEETIEELKVRWDNYINNANDGIAAAELGASITIARHELYPEICLSTRICPNCMVELPTSLLARPQCKGEFVSSGTAIRTRPVAIDLTKNQIEELIKEKDQELREINLTEEGEQINENDDQEDDPMGQPSADYSPGDNKEGEGDVSVEGATNKWDDRADDVELLRLMTMKMR